VSDSSKDIRDAARSVLLTPGPAEKAAAAREAAAGWRAGAFTLPGGDGDNRAPPRPARPARPALVAPGQVPRRRLSSGAGRAALLHAVAHIEFNAIDLAFDLVARFGGDPLIPNTQRRAFVDDWIGVGDDEARHFGLITARLSALGAAYGDLPAHDGLWSAAEATADDLSARLAVAPMVLEARGLDVTPGMIERLESAGDTESAAVLRVIYEEEVGHVAAGVRWLGVIADSLGEDPEALFQRQVRARFKGALKPPFNTAARDAAGLPATHYVPLAGETG